MCIRDRPQGSFQYQIGLYEGAELRTTFTYSQADIAAGGACFQDVTAWLREHAVSADYYVRIQGIGQSADGSVLDSAVTGPVGPFAATRLPVMANVRFAATRTGTGDEQVFGRWNALGVSVPGYTPQFDVVLYQNTNTEVALSSQATIGTSGIDLSHEFADKANPGTVPYTFKVKAKDNLEKGVFAQKDYVFAANPDKVYSGKLPAASGVTLRPAPVSYTHLAPMEAPAIDLSDPAKVQVVASKYADDLAAPGSEAEIRYTLKLWVKRVGGSDAYAVQDTYTDLTADGAGKLLQDVSSKIRKNDTETVDGQEKYINYYYKACLLYTSRCV